MLQTGHTGEKHAAEKDIDGQPLSSGCDAERGVMDPLHFLAKFYSCHGDDCLEYDKEEIETVSFDQVIVALGMWYRLVSVIIRVLVV